MNKFVNTQRNVAKTRGIADMFANWCEKLHMLRFWIGVKVGIQLENNVGKKHVGP